MLLSTRTSRKTESRRILAVHPVLSAFLLSLAFWSCTQTTAAPISRHDPESTDPGYKGISTARGSAVVVTANPLASTAALAALKKGGSAIDALVTAQAVLAVVEPQSLSLIHI